MHQMKITLDWDLVVMFGRNGAKKESKIYYLDDKNDCYYRLISTTEKKVRGYICTIFVLCLLNNNFL